MPYRLRNILKIDWLFLAIVFIGLLLRLHGLTKHDLWLDEVLTYDKISASNNCEAVCSNLYEKHPPLYFLLLRIWSYVFAKEAFNLRFFSVIFDILSILLVYKIGTLLFDRNCAIVSACFITFSPLHLWYSQEARMFTFSLFLILVNSYFFIKSLEDFKKYLAGYFFSLLASIFTSYFTLFIVVSQFLVLILFKKYRPLVLKWLLTIFLALSIFTAIFYKEWYSQFKLFNDMFWLPKSNSLLDILATFYYFVFGYNGSQFIFKIFCLLFVCIILFNILQLNREKKILGIFFLLPIFLIYLISRFYPIYLIRHLIIFSPFFYMFTAACILQIKRVSIKSLVILTFAINLTFSVLNYYSDIAFHKYVFSFAFPKKPTAQFVDFLLKYKEDGDAVGFANYGFMKTFRYYFSKLSKEEYLHTKKLYFYIPRADSYYDKLMEYKRKYAVGLGRYYESINFADINLESNKSWGEPNKRLWLFLTSWGRDGRLEPNDKAVKNWFDSHFAKEREWPVDGVLIILYELKPRGA